MIQGETLALFGFSCLGKVFGVKTKALDSESYFLIATYKM